MILLLFAAKLNEPCDNLKNDMIALEIYLQDQEDYKAFCPEKDWIQPELEVYKEKLTSQLPEDCKKDANE